VKPAFLSLRAFRYEEPPLHLELSAGNGAYCGTQEFYCDVVHLEAFGTALLSFPRSLKDEARLEVGKRERRWSHYVMLRAYVHDARGHTALEVELAANGRKLYGATAHFHIACEAASLNRLGFDLLAWSRNRSSPLEWQPAA
jgi:hypothetical protein